VCHSRLGRSRRHLDLLWVSRRSEVDLPGLTRLQQNGLTFENAFCAACMCSPTRASLLTGYFPAQHGVKYTLEESMDDSKYPQVELPQNFKNLASVMAAAGYNVVYKGKWHLSKPAGTEWAPSDVAKYGFARWNPPDAGANQDKDQEGGGSINNDGRFMNQTGSVDSGQEGALQYLNSAAAQQQPFFLIISLINPHDVLEYPKSYADDGYDDSWLEGEIGVPATVAENLSTKPSAQRQFLRISKLIGLLDTHQKKRNYLNFYGNLMKLIDCYLVNVLDALEAQNLLDNTLVIRTSDHGEMGLAHGGLRQKCFNTYEETMRVPLVYSNPRLWSKPQTSDAMVSHVDMLPTLASLVRAPASLAPGGKGSTTPIWCSRDSRRRPRTTSCSPTTTGRWDRPARRTSSRRSTSSACASGAGRSPSTTTSMARSPASGRCMTSSATRSSATTSPTRVTTEPRLRRRSTAGCAASWPGSRPSACGRYRTRPSPRPTAAPTCGRRSARWTSRPC
jgi:arylsulfatase A-like enzyme